MADDPYAAYGSSVDQSAPAATEQTVPAPVAKPAPQDTPAAAPADPYAHLGADAGPTTTDAATPQDVPGFSDDQKKQILAYLPKAKDASDLERYSSELSGGQSHLGNAQAVLDAYKQGHRTFGWEAPVAHPQAPQPGIGDQLLDATKNDVAGIVQGAAALPDAAAEAVGKVLSIIPNVISHGLRTAGHNEAADWVQNTITHNLANPVQIGNEVEKVAPTPDSTSGEAARVVGQVAGGAVTFPASASDALVGKLVGEVPKITTLAKPAVVKAVEQSAAHETASAAQDLGIELPAFAVQGPKATAQAIAKSKGGFGAADLGESAQTALDQSKAARDSIASRLAPNSELDPALGEQISTAATDARTAERARIGRMFTSGDEIMGDKPVPLSLTKQAIDSLIDQEDAALVPSAAAPILKQLQEKIGNGGPMTAAALRSSAQNLKSLMTSNSVDATTADHVLSTVTDAINGDISGAAKGTNAAKVYADARSQWGASKMLDKTVLKPLLGASFQNTGDQVARNIITAAKTNGTQISKLFSTLPDDVANGARSSLIARLGSPVDSAQNAAGDVFSLSDFLKNWNQLKGSRNLIFPKETVQALDKLAQVAEQGKSLEKVAANGASAQMGGFRQALHSTPLGIGAAASYFTHDPKEIVMGMLATGFAGLKQYRAAKLLASADFAKRLAATPMNPQGAAAYWSRPWVDTIAAKNRVIAGEILAFRKGIVAHANDGVVSSAAASADPDQEDQQQQPNP